MKKSLLLMGLLLISAMLLAACGGGEPEVAGETVTIFSACGEEQCEVFQSTFEGFIEETGIRWIEYDPVYEKMWEGMKNTMDPEVQEEKIRQMVQYLYEQAYALFIYTPITLYAANKEVNFVPYNCQVLRLKETSVSDNHWSVREKAEAE